MSIWMVKAEHRDGKEMRSNSMYRAMTLLYGIFRETVVALHTSNYFSLPAEIEYTFRTSHSLKLRMACPCIYNYQPMLVSVIKLTTSTDIVPVHSCTISARPTALQATRHWGTQDIGQPT